MSQERRLEAPGLQMLRRRALEGLSWGWPRGGGMSRTTSLPAVWEREMAGGGGGGKSSLVGAVAIVVVVLLVVASRVIVGTCGDCD